MRNSHKDLMRLRTNLFSIFAFEATEVDLNIFFLDFNQLFLCGWPK